jgi:hypothetical protein
LIWLTGRLAPDVKTIADFRKGNGKAIRSVCRQFVVLCRNLNLFSQSIIAIDGSKFKAVNNRDRNFTQGKVKARMQQIEQSIDRYLAAMDSADRATPEVAEAKAERLKEKIETLKKQMQKLKDIEAQIHASPDQQISLTDPDARSMATSGRGTGTLGYNVQTAVDDKHHLIIDHEVTNVGIDRGQLSNMANQARKEIEAESLKVVADRGYYKGLGILACEQAGITTFVPTPLTSGSKAEGRFGKQDFIYLAASDEYRCPAGQLLTRRHSSVEDGMLLHCDWFSGCQSSAKHKQCTTGKELRVVATFLYAKILYYRPSHWLQRMNRFRHPVQGGADIAIDSGGSGGLIGRLRMVVSRPEGGHRHQLDMVNTSICVAPSSQAIRAMTKIGMASSLPL